MRSVSQLLRGLDPPRMVPLRETGKKLWILDLLETLEPDQGQSDVIWVPILFPQRGEKSSCVSSLKCPNLSELVLFGDILWCPA